MLARCKMNGAENCIYSSSSSSIKKCGSMTHPRIIYYLGIRSPGTLCNSRHAFVKLQRKTMHSHFTNHPKRQNLHCFHRSHQRKTYQLGRSLEIRSKVSPFHSHIPQLRYHFISVTIKGDAALSQRYIGLIFQSYS